MPENPNEWPRAHTCLRDWCPKKTNDCDRCDAVLKIVREANAKRATQQGAKHDAQD